MTDGLENNTGVAVNPAPVTDSAISQDTKNISSEPTITTGAEELAPKVEAAIAKPEKTFSRDEVAKIVNAEKNKALEKEREKIRSEFTTQQQNQASAKTYTEQEIEGIVHRVAEQRVQQVVANKIVEEFSSKMLAGKSKYPDFEEAVSKLDLTKAPILVQWANSVDNTADIIYDIAKNPAKLVTILALAGHSPDLAFDELKKLSSSIKQNEDALKRQQPKEPLSQVQPSNTGVDNGSKTITDLRKEKWLWA